MLIAVIFELNQPRSRSLDESKRIGGLALEDNMVRRALSGYDRG